MTAGLDGKVMTCDRENRPLSVTHLGRTTTYVYGADGTRLKKIETDPVTQQSEVTLYMGPAEFRKWGQGNAEEILLYPTPNIRVTKIRDAGGNIVTKVNTLHVDGLGSVRAVTDETGLAAERSTYRPFGEEAEQLLSLSTPKETKGFIGERFDDTSGLQYLNARYYDPKLGLFVQPDWWEVTKPGVGTNRYSYSFGDPVNGRDPGGNAWYNDWNDFKDLFKSKRTFDPSTGQHNIKSAPILRTFVPGQVAWDNARTSYANGDYLSAALSGSQMLGEAVLAGASGRIVGGKAPASGGTANTGKAAVGEAQTEAVGSGAANAATHERLKRELRAKMRKPAVTNPELASLLDKIFRPNAKVGSGSTAAAVRSEMITGQPVGGAFHSQKAQDMAKALGNWLDRNPTARAGDRAAAENVMRDLLDALRGN